MSLTPTLVNQRRITLVRLPKRNIHLGTRITPRTVQARIPLHCYLDLHLDRHLDRHLLIPASPTRNLLNMEGITMDTRLDTSHGTTTSQGVTLDAVKIFTTTPIIIIITMKAVDILLEAFLNLFQKGHFKLCLRRRSVSQTRNRTEVKLHRDLDSRSHRSQTIPINMDGATEVPCDRGQLFCNFNLYTVVIN